MKTKIKKKQDENHTLLMMTNVIEATTNEKNFNIQQAVPNEIETTFTYENYKFNYTKSSFDDVLYGPAGEIKKKNYKLLLWTYDCNDIVMNNLSQYVLNQFAKSKIDNIWTQKIFNHNNTWTSTSVDKSKRKFSSVILNNNKHLDIADTLTHFNENEMWYLDRGIPYKKSFLFYGPPGTGKTSMIKAISYELQKHIYFLNLTNIKNDNEMATLLGKLNFNEMILVIEDIDAQGTVAHNRTLNNMTDSNDNDNKDNKDNKDKSKLSLSGLLNQIDGVQNNHGLILIMTTNNPRILDKALTRDGRVDERICFNFVDHEQIHSMFKNFYKDECPTLLEIKNKIDLISNKLTPANVENTMIKNYNNSKKALEQLSNIKNAFDEFKEYEF